MESLQENKATGQVYLYQTAQGYFKKLYICAKLWRPMDCLFQTNNPNFTPPPPHPFSSLYYQPNTLIPPHCNTIKATQHLKIMIWVWCRTLNTYSCMRQKKKTLANYCNDENSLCQSWWKMCRYDLQKKRQFYILEKFVISYNRAQRHLHSQDLVKCAGDRKIILCCIKDQDSWIIWESLTYYMHVLVLTY